jgi:hypothetical protein
MEVSRIAPLEGKPFAKTAHGGAGEGTRKKQMPSCNGLDGG